MNYSLHPEALGDLRDAAVFYREQAGTSLSHSFLGEFEESINNLLLHPALGSPWRGTGRRRYIMKHFPYSLVYTVSGNNIRILAVAHHNRRPDYWAGRK
jgi:toxin ParE1/3/4